MRTTLVTILANVSYGIIGFLLYRGRVITRNPLLDSDLVVFLAPALGVFIANGVIMWNAWSKPMRTRVRFALATTCAAAITFMAFWAYMGLGVNMYGE